MIVNLFENKMLSLQNEFSDDNSGVHPMFGPLSFEEVGEQNEDCKETECLLCDDRFNLKFGLSIFLQHVLEVHHLVIDKVQYIEDLPEYVREWKRKFSERGLEYYTPSLQVHEKGKYHLLCDDLPTDKKIRFQIRLEYYLRKQHFERTDKNFKRKCLLCRLVFEGTRHEYITHLSELHNVQLGNPQNLVNIEELVNELESKLDKLQCIYCEKFFPDRVILKEHMRKKLHKRLKTDNANYSKYFMVNYLEKESNWREDNETETPTDINDDDFVDWLEHEEYIYCLFCKHRETDLKIIFDHMKAVHGFALESEMSEIDFYKKIKMVNYIRKQVHQRTCIFCNSKCENLHHLLLHMKENNHYKLPEENIYNQPEYYFPTFENDTLLYLLDDGDAE